MAVRELGHCTRNPRATAALRALLSDPDVQLRLLAYESLREVDPDGVSQVVVGKKPENFMLEVVESGGPPTIYARRSQVRRMALIGGDRMVCQPPLLYSQQDKPVTISANEGDKTLTLIRKNPSGGILIGPIQVPMEVARPGSVFSARTWAATSRARSRAWGSTMPSFSICFTDSVRRAG